MQIIDGFRALGVTSGKPFYFLFHRGFGLREIMAVWGVESDGF
jgi:hypothetical protein